MITIEEQRARNRLYKIGVYKKKEPLNDIFKNKKDERIAQAIAEGLPYKMIAPAVKLQIRAVAKRVDNMRRRANARSNEQLIAIVITKGYISI